MSFTCEIAGDLELEPDGEQYHVFHQGQAACTITYQSSEKKRWICACGKQVDNRKGILAHVRYEHLGLPHPLGTRPALSTASAQAALYKMNGPHADPTYEQAVFNITHPRLALL